MKSPKAKPSNISEICRLSFEESGRSIQTKKDRVGLRSRRNLCAESSPELFRFVQRLIGAEDQSATVSD